MMKIEPEELKIIADMTVKLTELRQNECKHLAVNHAAPDIFGNLLKEYGAFKWEMEHFNDGVVQHSLHKVRL